MEIKHSLPDLEEVLRSRRPVKNSIDTTQRTLSKTEKMAVYITHHVGSTQFFLVLLVWSVGWLLWNLFAPLEYRFDPAPAFVIWLALSNLMQLILLPLILVGQNLEDRYVNIKATADYNLAKRNEEEIKVILGHLENQNEVLLEIMRKLER